MESPADTDFVALGLENNSWNVVCVLSKYTWSFVDLQGRSGQNSTKCFWITHVLQECRSTSRPKSNQYRSLPRIQESPSAFHGRTSGLLVRHLRLLLPQILISLVSFHQISPPTELTNRGSSVVKLSLLTWLTPLVALELCLLGIWKIGIWTHL